MPPRTQKSTFSEEDIVMYLALALKHLRLMVLLVCFSLMLGVVYYVFARPVYHSKALVQVRMLPQPVDTQTLFHDSDERNLKKYFSFTSESLIEDTAKHFDVHASYKEITGKYLKLVTCKWELPAGRLTIDAWPYSAEWAAKWPEAMVQEYLSWREEYRQDLIAATIESFTKEMAQMKEKMSQNIDTKFDARESNQMTQIIMDLNHYKEIPRRLVAITNQQVLMATKNDQLHNAGRDTADKLAILSRGEQELHAKEREHQIVSQVNIVNPGDVLPKDDPAGLVVLPDMVSSAPNEPWMELDKQRREKQREYEELGSKGYLPKFPKVLALKKEIDSINDKLNLELKRALSQWDLTYARLADEQKSLLAELPKLYEVERQYARATKEYDGFDGNELPWSKYLAEMNKRLEALEFGADNERARMWFDRMIEMPNKPVSPNVFTLFKFLLLGLGLAIAVPFLIEYLDSRVSDVDQVEETLRLRSLGVLPKVTDIAMEELMGEYGDAKSNQHIQENFRLIRTNLVMNSATPAMPQVILITSSMPQEGKTVVAYNLALSFAKKGEKTLIIDADLRRGRLHRISACHNKPGLSEVLTHDLPVLESCRVIGRGSINGYLSLLPCGKHIHSASELLDSPRFPKLIDGLRQKYQRIIIDTPPVLGLAETSIIQRVADGVLLVIWSNWTPMRDVKTAVQTLQTNGAKFLGFVLNRLDFKALTNRYKYFYYSPYYYANYQPPEPPPAPQLTAAE